MTQEKTWFSYKGNQLIALGFFVVVAFTGVLIYVKRQENLFEEISNAIDSKNKLEAGIYGDWRDLAGGDFWNPKLYLSRKDIQPPTIDQITASKYAKEIHDSIGALSITSNQDAAIAVFKKLSNRADLSKVADRFSSIYKGTLLNFLNTHFNSALTQNYVIQIYELVKSLPI